MLDNIKVNSFDVYKAEEELKKCPAIIKTYVKLLKQTLERQKDLTNLAIKKKQNMELVITDDSFLQQGKLFYELVENIQREIIDEIFNKAKI